MEYNERCSQGQQLERPETDVWDLREAVVADIFTTVHFCAAAESGLFVNVNSATYRRHNNETKDENAEIPRSTKDCAVMIELPGDVVDDVPHIRRWLFIKHLLLSLKTWKFNFVFIRDWQIKPTKSYLVYQGHKDDGK